MAKSRFIGLKVTDAELAQIKSAKLTKETLSQTVRRLLSKALKEEREDIRGWEDLIAKIENADISKISEKLDIVISVLRQTLEEITELTASKNDQSGVEDAIKKLKYVASLTVAIPAIAKEINRHEELKKFLERKG